VLSYLDVIRGSSSNPLGPYKVSDVTVSGISAGGFMAVQLHVAYSSVINGSAAFAAVKFYLSFEINFDLFKHLFS
jgi:hypothetical protein